MVCLLPLVIVAAIGDPSTSLAHDPLVTLSHPASTAELQRSESSRRVRVLDRQAERLLAEGMRRSRTFRSLIAAVQKTDVIVYVESTHDLPPRVGGRLLLQAVTGHERYLRVQVRESLRQNAAIATVAHELRHVLEVAAERSVVDQPGLLALYRRIGHPSAVKHGYDTNAARLTGHIVRRELGI